MEQIGKIEETLEGIVFFFWYYCRTYLEMMTKPHRIESVMRQETGDRRPISPLVFFATSAFAFSTTQEYILIDIDEVIGFLFSNQLFLPSVKEFLEHLFDNLNENNFSLWGFLTAILPVTIVALSVARLSAFLITENAEDYAVLHSVFLYLAALQCASSVLSIAIFMIVYSIINSPFSNAPGIIAIVFFAYSTAHPLIVLGCRFVSRGIRKNVLYGIFTIVATLQIFAMQAIIAAKNSIVQFADKKEVVKPTIELLPKDERDRSQVIVSEINGVVQIEGILQVNNPYDEKIVLRRDQLGTIAKTNFESVEIQMTAMRWASNDDPILVLSPGDVAWINFRAVLSEELYSEYANRNFMGKIPHLEPYTITVFFHRVDSQRRHIQYYTHLVIKKTG